MPYSRFLFLNIGHALDHLFILLFPAVAALAASELQEDYATLLALTTGSFMASHSIIPPDIFCARLKPASRSWRVAVPDD